MSLDFQHTTAHRGPNPFPRIVKGHGNLLLVRAKKNYNRTLKASLVQGNCTESIGDFQQRRQTGGTATTKHRQPNPTRIATGHGNLQIKQVMESYNQNQRTSLATRKSHRQDRQLQKADVRTTTSVETPENHHCQKAIATTTRQ